MDADQNIWRVWARFLQRLGIGNGVAVLLEAAGPLTILGAQAVYISQPVLNHTFLDEHLDALARLLEDSTQTRAFIKLLREASLT